jgi:long-chain alkane monooxygenase
MQHIHFCLLDMATVSHNNYGLWAHPSNTHACYNDIDYWVNFARLLERGKFDAIFFADVVGISEGYGNSYEVSVREGMHVPNGDPFMVVPLMAAVTQHLGFVVTSSATYDPPFALARRMSTLDHLTKGRIGWNVVTSYLPTAARNFGLKREVPHDERYEAAEDYMEAVYKLWEASWEDGAVLADRQNQRYADPSKVHRINHVGKYHQVAGPHLCSPSLQRTPMIFQAGSSDRGRSFAGKHAEGVFVGGYTEAVLRPYIQDLRAEATNFGRDPNHLKTLAMCNIVVAPTTAEAQAKVDDYLAWSRADGYLAHRFGSGLDLSPYDRTTKIMDIISRGGPGAAHIARYPFPAGTTVGDIYDDAARIDRKRLFVAGNPQQVADKIEEWVDAFGIDGFLLGQHVTPGTVADFVEWVVPELQRRGRYRTEYSESTLRERFLGAGAPTLPSTHPGAAYRRSTSAQ